MISAIWTVVQDVVTGFFSSVGEGIQSFVDILWDSTAKTMTTAGELFFFALGLSLSFFAIGFVVRLARIRR